MTITFKENIISITTEAKLVNSKLEAKLDEEFDEVTADGRKVKVS